EPLPELVPEAVAGTAASEPGHRRSLPDGARKNARRRDTPQTALDGVEGPSCLWEARPRGRPEGEATLARHPSHEGRSPAREEAAPDPRPPAHNGVTPQDASGRSRPGAPPPRLRRRAPTQRARGTRGRRPGGGRGRPRHPPPKEQDGPDRKGPPKRHSLWQD